MKKLIAYDLDGTLANTREDIVCAIQYMLDRMGEPSLGADEIIKHVGSGLHELVKGSLKTEDPKKIEQGAKHYRAHYNAHMMDHTLLYPGMRHLLNYFGARVQAVITNKPNPFTLRMLEALSIAGYFRHVISGNDSFPKKPDPASFLHVLADEGLSPADALYIGDSVVDIQTGRAAGVETVVLTHGFNSIDQLQSENPDYIAAGAEELLALVKKNHW